MNKTEISTIAFLSVVLFFRMFGVFVVLPIFTLYAFKLNYATPFLVGLAFGGYAITQAIFQIPMGILSDIWSRRGVLILGLSIFGIGCLVSGFAESIYLMFLGRLLQGVGAISAVLFTAVGDNVRSSFQFRAMAILGISVGFAFIFGFGLSTVLGAIFGLNYIFLGLAVISFALVALLSIVKLNEPAVKTPVKESLNFDEFRDKKLILPLCIGFSASFGLSYFMYHLPLELKNANIATAQYWVYYLPLLAVGILFMPISAVLAEKYNKLKAVIVFALTTIFLSGIVGEFWLYNTGSSLLLFLVGLYLFFIGFNIFEPILPALILKLSKSGKRGKSNGLLAFFQFFGSFLGSLSAGLFFFDLKYLPYLVLIITASVLIYWSAKFNLN